MRTLKDSDIFSNYINKGNAVFGRISEIVMPDSPAIFLNDVLYSEIKKKIIDKKRSEMVFKIDKAIKSGQMLLFTLPPEKRLSSQIPFIVFKQNGVQRVIVNLCGLVSEHKYNDGSSEYEISDNIDKVYVLIYSAYLAIDNLSENSIQSPDVLYNAAVLWAEMFNKPIYDSIGLNNTERYDAYLYFSMKFFLVYFMGCTEDQAEAMASKRVPHKNLLMVQMIDVIESRQLKLYDGITTYLSTILDNEVANTKGLRFNSLDKSMNITHYFTKFKNSYGENAILSLCAFPYFIYTIQSAFAKTKMMHDRSFERIFTMNANAKCLNKLLVDILK